MELVLIILVGNDCSSSPFQQDWKILIIIPSWKTIIYKRQCITAGGHPCWTPPTCSGCVLPYILWLVCSSWGWNVGKMGTSVSLSCLQVTGWLFIFLKMGPHCPNFLFWIMNCLLICSLLSFASGLFCLSSVAEWRAYLYNLKFTFSKLLLHQQKSMKTAPSFHREWIVALLYRWCLVEIPSELWTTNLVIFIRVVFVDELLD